MHEKIAQLIFADVAQGLAYMHHPKILVANRDIKPENIVFTTENGGTSVGKRDRALIVDFTTAEQIPEGKEATFKVIKDGGTPAFEAPETLAGDHRPLPLDVWSLGVSIASVVFGKLPFPGATQQEIEDGVANKEPQLNADVVVSDDCRQLIAACLIKDPTKRPTIHEAIENFKWL